MKAQIGLMIEGQMGLNWERWDRLLALAERAGFQNVFCSDHIVDPEPPDQDSLELWAALTYAAAKTKRIEFGPLVSPVTFRHPVMALRQAAAVDDLSAGRLVFGLGAGWNEREHANFGIGFYDFKTRFAQLTDALEITRRLLDENQPVTYAGEHFSLRDAVLLPRPARRMPVAVGGNGPKRTLPLAARYADEWNAVFIKAEEFSVLNRRLDELIELENREASDIKRSIMIPFDWVSGDNATEILSNYIEAGCQRFMLQYLDYDNLDPLERWAEENMRHFD